MTAAPHCITCGDIADEMRVLQIDAGRELALCAAGDQHTTVEIGLVGAARSPATPSSSTPASR